MAASPASASAVNFMAGKLRVVEGRVGELIAKYEFLAHKIEQMEARVEALKGERSEKQEVAEASRATVAVGTESPKFLRVCMCDGEEQAKVVGPMDLDEGDAVDAPRSTCSPVHAPYGCSPSTAAPSPHLPEFEVVDDDGEDSAVEGSSVVPWGACPGWQPWGPAPAVDEAQLVLFESVVGGCGASSFGEGLGGLHGAQGGASDHLQLGDCLMYQIEVEDGAGGRCMHRDHQTLQAVSVMECSAKGELALGGPVGEQLVAEHIGNAQEPHADQSKVDSLAGGSGVSLCNAGSLSAGAGGEVSLRVQVQRLVASGDMCGALELLEKEIEEIQAVETG